MQSGNDALNAMLLEQQKLQYLQAHEEEIVEQRREGIFASAQAVTLAEEAQKTTAWESVKSGVANTPLYRDLKNMYQTRNMMRDEDYNPTAQAFAGQDELGSGVFEKLMDTGSQEEFDYFMDEFRQQKLNQKRASASLVGQASTAISSLASMENLLLTVGTAGVGQWGVIANSARQGMVANSIRGSVAGSLSAGVGASIDADNNIAFSSEDIGFAMLFGAVGGGLYGGSVGKVYDKNIWDRATPKTFQGDRLYSFGGATMDGARTIFNRATGNAYREYVKLHTKKAQDAFDLKDKVDNLQTGIHKTDIDDLDFRILNLPDGDLGSEVKDWFNRNQIGERQENITKAERYLDKATPEQLQSAYGVAMTSNSPLAKALAINTLESPTGAVVKNSTSAMKMERYQGDLSMSAIPAYRGAFNSYLRKQTATPTLKNGVRQFAGDLWTMGKNYHKVRADFNKEVYRYMNSIRNGTPLQKVSDEVKQLADTLDERFNRPAFDLAQRAGVDGFGDIQFKRGYLHQRHESVYYVRAVAKHGKDRVVNVLQKALQSRKGAGITDTAKAKAIANAFVDRFTTSKPDLRAGSVLEDDAWEIMQDIFQKEGYDFDGKDIKELFKAEVADTAKDKGRARYAKDRIPLDLDVTDGELSMLDLVNTDVENLLGSYAMSMGGHIALAEAGITGRGSWLKLRKAIIAEDPKLEGWLDDYYQTFSTGRTAGGISSPAVARASKLAVLSYLNNLGFAQLSESGTAMATYGLSAFAQQAGEVYGSMWKGKRTVPATRLAEEIREGGLEWLGKEHIAQPPHLNQELVSNSTLSEMTMWDTVDGAMNTMQSIQGHTSLFNMARSTQQTLSYGMLVHKIGRYIDDGKMLDKQLASLGMSEEIFDNVKHNINKFGTKVDGKRELIGFDQWDDATKDAFINVVVRNQNQIVQKAMAGEGSFWMSKDMGSLLTQFRKFPIESIRKQLVRKHTISNELLVQSALYNLVVAGSVITARNYLTGSNTDADLESALRQGIVYNADLGSIASIWDLGLTLTGAPDSMAISPYAYLTDDVISVPALSALNSTARVGGALLDGLDGDMDADSLRTMRALPIIGNHVAFARMMRPDD